MPAHQSELLAKFAELDPRLTRIESEPEELEICKRRGHEIKGLSSDRWKQCRWCGMWLRGVCVIEEREDKPPRDEQDPLGKYIG